MNSERKTTATAGSEAVVVGVGARTAIGLDMRMTADSIAAGLKRFREVSYLRDRTDGHPIVMSLLASLSADTFAAARMEQLAIGAAREALAPLGDAARADGQMAIPVLLSVPPKRPRFSDTDMASLAKSVMQGLGSRLDRGRCSLLGTGAEAAIGALAQAAQLLRETEVPAVLVGGVESYKDIDTLQWIDSTERLKRPGRPNGITPGEGAGFLLLCRADRAREQGWRPLARLLAVGHGSEPHPWYSGQAHLAEGLTQAVQAAFAEPETENLSVTSVWSDLNGEAWRAEEWSYTYLRSAAHHPEPMNLLHPADCWGDLGAASGATLAALAAYQLHHDPLPAASSLVWCASAQSPYRAACVLGKWVEDAAA